MPNANNISEYVAAAICGNMVQESSINPARWEGNATGHTWTDLNIGYGLGQWTNTGGDTHGRLYQLHEYLSTNGFSDDDGDGQVSYIPVEDVWYRDSTYPFNNLTEFLNSTSTDVIMLTHAWNKCWEGIHDASWDTRVAYAAECLEYIRAHGTESKTWIKGNRALTKNEWLNNSILVFQSLGGTIVGSKKGMPVYMMCRRRY